MKKTQSSVAVSLETYAKLKEISEKEKRNKKTVLEILIDEKFNKLQGENK
jgi:predicted DNA-binding protein